MIEGLDPGSLLVALAVLAGAAAAGLLGAGWLRQRRARQPVDAATARPRRLPVRRVTDDPMLASLGLPDEPPRGEPER